MLVVYGREEGREETNGVAKTTGTDVISVLCG